MCNSVEIRKCAETDIVRTGEFYDRVVMWLNDHVNYPRWIYKVYPSEQSVRAMTEAGTQYICLSGDKILGSFALGEETQGSYQKCRWSRELADGSYMVLTALAIEPELQRKGLGSEIIAYCVDKAAREGYKAIRVDIVPANIPARSLFERNGFTYAGDVDLELDIGDIPEFSMYELNW